MINICMKNYRKIYKQHHGSIPKDSQGRSCEIHHIDGDHTNNDIANLKLVTIEEHYELHKSQGDWVSCFMIAQRMNLSPKELSEVASRSASITNATRVANGTHVFLNREAAKQRNLKRIAEGTHNLISDLNPVYNLIKQGKHHFQTANPSQNITNGRLLPAHIKLSCIFCKKQTSINKFKRDHSKCWA